MKILIIGAGGREHSLILKLNESKNVDKIYCIPGNPGINKIAEPIANIKINEIAKMIEFVKSNDIDLTVVGPEQPLIEGIVDEFRDQDLNIFGPTKAAAEIEGSKAFSKNLMHKYNIPTARYKIFNDLIKANDYLESQSFPLVVKASGLAAGKGAIVCYNICEAKDALYDMLHDNKFGSAGSEVVIEEFMEGEEASVFAISDNKYYQILAPAQDHKKIFDNDKGPNTGGMGSYAPAPCVDNEMMTTIETDIIKPIFNAMKLENKIYTGVLFIGLMITDDGPKVIEFNCRFGDPETQVILPILDADLADVLYYSATNSFTENRILPVKNEHSICLVAVSGGYPGVYEKGKIISGLKDISDNITIIHAGTVEDNGNILTAGGRVLALVTNQNSLDIAVKTIYKEMEKIQFPGIYYRNDIGKKGLKHYNTN